MVNYAYLKKLKQNGNLPVAIIDFLSNFVEATYFRLKNGDILRHHADTRGTEYLLSKVNFPTKLAIYTTFQLFPIKM